MDSYTSLSGAAWNIESLQSNSDKYLYNRMGSAEFWADMLKNREHTDITPS